jgi:hypothetical protein
VRVRACPPQLDELVGAYPNYNEEEEERRYYRRKRLGVLKNVLAASAGGTLTYGVYLGTAGRDGRRAGPGCPRARAGKEKPCGSRPRSPFTSRPRGCSCSGHPPPSMGKGGGGMR